MSPFLQLALSLVIIIFAAKIGGLISYRLKQPSVLGELIIGILLGPTLIDLIHWSYFTDDHLLETIHQLAEVGVLLLMFLAGLDLHLSELARSGKIAFMAGLFGVLLPFSMGAGVGLTFGMDNLHAIFLGLILSATSVSISAQTLMELGVLRSKVGVVLLGAAVFDDILVVLGLSIFVALSQSGSTGATDVLWLLLRMGLFLSLSVFLGLLFLPRLSVFIDKLPVSRGVVTFAFGMVLLYAWMAESLGSMAAITGAFLAGLILSRSKVKERIESGISTIAYGVFVPIFFINIGLSADAHNLRLESLGILAVLVLVAVVGKVLGSGAGAYLAGLPRLEALQVGAGMISRGEVGLIVAAVGVNEGWLLPEIFAAVIGVVIATTLITPPALRSLFPKKEKHPPVLQKNSQGDKP